MFLRYEAMVASGQMPTSDLAMMAEEIRHLEAIAEAHPQHADAAYKTAEGWAALMQFIRSRLH